MQRLILLIFVLLCALSFCRTEDIKEETPQDFLEYLEETISSIESTTAFAEKVVREGILPLEETEKHYDKIVDSVEDIIEMIRAPDHAYAFVKAKGIERVIITNISVQYPKLRASLLILLKLLFEMLPTTTDAVIPTFAIDKLVDIFDTEDHLGIKAHALDILSVWLVGNPKAQVRVMKMRGLEPFYRQIPKLSPSVTVSLIDLFNKIFEEHIKVRNDVRQRSKADSDKYILYQRMGLLERVSTPDFCEGLVNIVYSTWSNSAAEIPGPILKMVMNTLPYCEKANTGQRKAIKLFDALLNHVKTASKEMYLGQADLNLTEIRAVLDNHVKKIRGDSQLKDEF